jgi:uncharacterized cupredoxin-like copper-binding protein
MRPTNRLAHRRKAALTGLAVIAFAVAACGTSATPTTNTPEPAGPATVDVTLQEWAVVPSVTSVKAGSVTFNAKNAGPKEQHEMVVMKTDLGILDLPKGADGKVDEEGAGVKAIGEIEEFAVGATGSVTLDLAAGKYVLICNVVDSDGTSHYGKGMTTAFTVE